MKSEDQTRITLAKVKYAAFASQETNCFEAVVLFDGKPVCHASNEGTGGCDSHHPLKGENFRDMEARLAPVHAFIATLEPYTFPDCDPLPHDLDTVVGDALERFLVEREFDRRIKKNLLYVRSDRPGVIWRAKVPADKFDVALNQWRAKHPHVTYTALNALPRAEALRLYRGAA
jgi:hypothetical protein